jgi:CBS domain-containing protein
VSERDASAAVRQAGGRELPVREVMAARAVTVAKTDTVKKAANLMRGRSIGSLVVLERNRPVGIITASDLLELIGRGGARVTEARPRPLLQHRVPHKKRHHAAGAW